MDMKKSSAELAADAARNRLAELNKRLEQMGADNALQVYSLAASIDRVVECGGGLGHIALVLSSTRYAVKLNDQLHEQQLGAQRLVAEKGGLDV